MKTSHEENGPTKRENARGRKVQGNEQSGRSSSVENNLTEETKQEEGKSRRKKEIFWEPIEKWKTLIITPRESNLCCVVPILGWGF